MNLNVGINYKILDKIEPPDIVTQSKNISEGGICIILLEKVINGAVLDLTFTLLGSDEPVRTMGRVAWISEFIVGDPRTGRAYEAGVEFIDISDDDRKKISEYVIRHL